MTCCLPCLVGEHFSVPLAHGYEELVNGHGGVNGNFSSKEGFNVMLFDTGGRMLGEQSSKSFNAHPEIDLDAFGDVRGVTELSLSRKAKSTYIVTTNYITARTE